MYLIEFEIEHGCPRLSRKYRSRHRAQMVRAAVEARTGWRSRLYYVPRDGAPWQLD